ncbi:MAG TPA: cellulase family glycosylhydrolase, partial [Terriglobales bacterium]|nr:cellulase family glycosylhydrolase [Terriglobales bacterium]
MWRNRTRTWLVAVPLVALLVAVAAWVARTPTTVSAAPSIAGLKVSGNHLVNSSGQTVTLWGVNRSGGEYACVPHPFTDAMGNRQWSVPGSIFDGPMDANAVAAIAGWAGVNAVRVPLNEECWLGSGNIPAAFAGSNYISAVQAYVNVLHSHGLVAILDLHWTEGKYSNQDGISPACKEPTGQFANSNFSEFQAICQKPMPDAALSVPFWTAVANTFKGDLSSIFDLFNEPFPDFFLGSGAPSWTCWRDGGTACGSLLQNTSGGNVSAAGMQQLVNAVRGTGAANVIMLGGLAFSNDVSMWNQFKPSDPTGNLAASWHSYNFNSCSNSSCWQTNVAPVAAANPVIAGEIGENDCNHSYIDGVMSFLDGVHQSYAGWAWNADFQCSSGPSLITDYNGTPTAFGAGFKAHVAMFASPTPTPSMSPTSTPTVTPTPTPTPTPTATPTPTPTPTPSGGSLSATPVVASSSPWFNEED